MLVAGRSAVEFRATFEVDDEEAAFAYAEERIGSVEA